MMESKGKLISVLHKLINENFSVSDDTILDKLYTHVVNDKSKGEIYPLLPQIADWVEEVTTIWNCNEVLNGVKIFSIRFIGYIGSEHEGFSALKNKNLLKFFSDLILCSESDLDSCFMVPLIKMFELFVKHKEGWKWVIETAVWKGAVEGYYKTGSIYAKRSCVQFMSKILSESAKYDIGVAKDMLTLVCEPLLTNHVITLEPIGTDVRECYNGVTVKVTKRLEQAAKYLCDILEDMLSRESRPSMNISLVSRSNCKESVLVSDILANCCSLQQHRQYSSLLLVVSVIGAMFDYNRQVELPIRPVLRTTLLVGVPSFCATCLFWLDKLRQTSPQSHFNSSFEEQETTLISILVLFLGNARNAYSTTDGSDQKAVIDDCLLALGEDQKLHLRLNQLSVHEITRSLSLVKHEKNIITVLTAIDISLDKLVERFKTEQDILRPILLQLLNLLYKLIEMIQDSPGVSKQPLFFQSSGNICSSIIKLLTTKSTNNDIRVTVIAMQTYMKFLKYILQSEFKRDDSNLEVTYFNQLLPVDLLIVDKLLHTSWEVQDTALEFSRDLLQFHGIEVPNILHLFTPELLNIIFEKTSTDESGYVRESALRFITEAVKYKLFKSNLPPPKLLELGLNSVLNDEVPGVRKSACNLVSAIYVTHIPTLILADDKLYAVMFTACTKDLDWEVKVSALEFWSCIIHRQLKEACQPCTFEDNPATATNLRTALKTLGEIGCLKALWLGLNDDCDIKVSQRAEDIVRPLEDLKQTWIGEDLNTIISSIDGLGGGEHVISRQMNPSQFFAHLQNDKWRERIKCSVEWSENTCDNLASLIDHILIEDNPSVDWDYNTVDCY